jgi:hypothetical protein
LKIKFAPKGNTIQSEINRLIVYKETQVDPTTSTQNPQGDINQGNNYVVLRKELYNFES